MVDSKWRNSNSGLRKKRKRTDDLDGGSLKKKAATTKEMGDATKIEIDGASKQGDLNNESKDASVEEAPPPKMPRAAKKAKKPSEPSMDTRRKTRSMSRSEDSGNQSVPVTPGKENPHSGDEGQSVQSKKRRSTRNRPQP